MTGAGIIKGLLETARNFVGTYARRDRFLSTVEYPEKRLPLPENSRNFPILIHDGEDPEAGLRCVACRICEKECPPQCIYIEKSEEKKPDHLGKPQFFPAAFDIDISVCMSCQICVEVCPFDAIEMDTEYELSHTDRFGGLLLGKDRLARPAGYLARIHPGRAREVAARREEAARKAAEKAAARKPKAQEGE